MLRTCAYIHVAYTRACVHVAVRVRDSSTFMNQGWELDNGHELGLGARQRW